MSRTDRDVRRIVESWLEDGVRQLPDRVLDAVERQLPATHQRRAGWLARRFPVMNNTTLRYGIAAAAVVIVAFVGVRFLTPPDLAGPGPVATPTPTLQPTPTAEPTPAFPPLGVHDTVEAGRYTVGTLPFNVSVDVPAGWGAGDWTVIGPRGADEPDGMAIRFFTDDFLFEDPADETGPLIEVGPTVDDMVQAIVDHPAWETSDPVEITMDGRAGQIVELTIPADAEMTPDKEFFLFSNGQGGHVWGWALGQTFALYIVDVDGERLIIDAWHYAGTADEDVDAQRSVVESVQFDL